MLILAPEKSTFHSNSSNNRPKLVNAYLFFVSDKEVEATHEPDPQAAEVTSMSSPVLQFMLFDNEQIRFE